MLSSLNVRHLPKSIQLQKKLHVKTENTLGGKVVQVLGIEFTGLTMVLPIGLGRKRSVPADQLVVKDTKSFGSMIYDQAYDIENIRSYIKKAMVNIAQTGEDLVFCYPGRTWGLKLTPRDLGTLQRSVKQASVDITLDFNVTEASSALRKEAILAAFDKLDVSMFETVKNVYNHPGKEVSSLEELEKYLEGIFREPWEIVLPGAEVPAK